MLNWIYKRDGSVMILVSIALVAIMAIMALVIDLGVVYAEKAKLSKAIDAAILAGGQELPADIEKARSVMELYLIENGVGLERVTINIDADGLGAEIIGIKNVEHKFAKIIGFDNTDVTERSKIILGPASTARGGLRPFGVTKFEYEYGDTILLKYGVGDSYHGNFGTVALGGSGAALLLENALYGYDGVVKIGDWINTEPGNMASMINPLRYYVNSFDETFETFERDSDRVWTVPLIDSLDNSGRDAVQVVGFGQFFVESVKKIGGDATITGRFVQFVTNGDIDETIEDTGTYGMKLVE